MTLKDLLHKSKNHLGFWELLEKAGGRLLFEEYVANEADELKKKAADRYGEKMLAYRTILVHVVTLVP